MTLALTSMGRFVDAFESDDLAANWMVIQGLWAISGGLLTTSGYSTKSIYEKAISAGDQEVEAVSITGSAGFFARLQDGSNHYYLYLASFWSGSLVKVVGGSATTLANTTFSWETGDIISLRATGMGSNTRLTVYRNGTAVTGLTNINPSVADGVLSTGYGGCFHYGGTHGL